MNVLTLEVPDKLLESLKAQAQKANTTVEKLALSALSEKTYTDQLRADAQAGLDALKEGRYTEYDSADEMMDDTERMIRERRAARENGTR